MQPCPHCQRTFLPDRLEIHLRTCGKGHFANPKPRRKSCGDGEDEDAKQHAAARRRGAGAVSDCWRTSACGTRTIVLPIVRSLRPS